MISLAYILRNEEKYIARSINSVKSICEEIIVIDAHSSDKTRKICKKLSCKIYLKKWINDFSVARNYMISKCSQPWILTLDADEHLEEENLGIILEAIKISEKNNIVAWSFPRKNHYPIHESESPYYGPPFYPDFQTRLFKNCKEIFYSGKIHEGVVQSIESSRIGDIGRLSVTIHHHMFRGNQAKYEEEKAEYYESIHKGELNAK